MNLPSPRRERADVIDRLRPNVRWYIAIASPTSDLRPRSGPQAPDSSTRSRAADLRPRLMSPGIRLPAARPEPQHKTFSITLPPNQPQRTPIQSVSRRGRRRSQGGMTDLSWFGPVSPHQQAKRPLSLCPSFTHSGPPASFGAPGPGPQHVKPCCGPPTSPDAPRHQASGRKAGTFLIFHGGRA